MPGHTADFGQKGNIKSASYYIPSYTGSLNRSCLYADPSAFKDLALQSLNSHALFSWLPIFVNPKGGMVVQKPWTSIWETKVWKPQPIFYSFVIHQSIQKITVTLQIYCNNVFSEDKNMTHFTFKAETKYIRLIFQTYILSCHVFCGFALLFLLLFGNWDKIFALRPSGFWHQSLLKCFHLLLSSSWDRDTCKSPMCRKLSV